MNKQKEIKTIEKKYYTLSKLKELGFSKSLIDKYFSEPILKPNPIFKSASPMKLYDAEKVEAFITTNIFKEHIQKRKKRSEIAISVALKHKNETLDYIHKKIDEISIKRINIELLMELTLQNKEDWYSRYGFYELVYDEKTLNRWMINYVRHNLTTYDDTLYSIKGKTGKNVAYNIYRNAVMDKIKEIYPELFISLIKDEK